MLPEPRNLPRLMAIARALGPVLERVVQVGGAIVNLYSTSATRTPEPRRNDHAGTNVGGGPRLALSPAGRQLQRSTTRVVGVRSPFRLRHALPLGSRRP